MKSITQKTIAAHLLLWLVFFLFSAAPAAAHRVTVFAWVEGDTVHTQSKFSGGKRVKGGTVKVYDARGQALLSGATDTEGLFSFSPPGKEDLLIVIEAGMGHRGEWRLEKAAFGGSEASGNPAPAPAPEAPARGSGLEIPVPPPAANVSAEEIAALLEKALDKKLSPVLAALSEARDPGPGARDILGGIGYILGLVGLYAFVRFRKNDKRAEDR